MKVLTSCLLILYSLIIVFSFSNCSEDCDDIFIDTTYIVSTDTIFIYDTIPIQIPTLAGYEYLGSIDDHLYYVNSKSTSWTEANSLANKHGHLVTISNEFENDSILSMISSLEGQPHVWIGLNDSNTEGSFEWVTDEDVSYTNWNSGEPNNQNDEDYTIMHGSNHNNSGSWADQPNSINIYKHLLEIE